MQAQDCGHEMPLGEAGVPLPMQVELIDNWHKAWPRVLESIDETGGRERLLVGGDGWLSARQSLLVAFQNERPVGHVVFHVEPVWSTGANPNRPPVDARLDDLRVRTGFSEAQVRKLLLDAASRHAKSLRARRLIGFDER